MNGYCLILSNPTPRTREMTIPVGRRLGINEGVISTAQEVTIEIDPFTRLAIYYDVAGNRVLDRRTIDDINVIGEVEMIDVSVNGASIVPVDIDNSELNGSKVSRDLFSARARDLCEGITEDADRRMGGSMLVAQLSYLRSQRDGQRVGIYSPAALNLRCDDGVDTLYSLMSAGDISLTTCVGKGYNRSGALELCVRNNTERELRVRIPQGCAVRAGRMEREPEPGGQGGAVRDHRSGEGGDLPAVRLLRQRLRGRPQRRRHEHHPVHLRGPRRLLRGPDPRLALVRWRRRTNSPLRLRLDSENSELGKRLSEVGGQYRRNM